MARATFPTYSARDFAFTVAGVCTFLCDVGSDLCVARDLYTRGHWLWFGVFMGCLLVSSVIVQMFSWLWLQYDRDLEDFDAHVTAGSPILFGGDKQMTRALLLHVCQLGFFCRHMSAIWQGFRVWRHGGSGSEYAVYMTHDLSMLRLIETFCESAPQLTLMIYIMLRSNHARVVQCVSVVASTTSIAWMVVDYHRSLRSFLPDKDKQAWTSSLIYFLWNLLLIGPRVASIALFASVLPCLIAGHFLLLWIVFVSWAWRQRTDFMDSAVGEWLYRSIIGVIWYFSWFNVAEGHTRGRSIIYHSFIIADSVVLLVTWWCYRDSEVIQAYALIVIICIPLAYVVGLLIKVLYYNCFHPKLWRPVASGKVIDDVSDGMKPFSTVQTDSASVHVSNKRMGRHAANFYTSVFKTNRSKESNESVL